MLLYALIILAFSVAACSCLRCLLLKKSLRAANEELREIMTHLTENRIMKMPQPDPDIERLLETINDLLADARRKTVHYAHREAELKAQIEHISHDLRTPLTSIQGYLSFIDIKALQEEEQGALAVIQRKTDSLQRLITQFYELSCLDSDGTALNMRVHDVGHLLREAITVHYKPLSERGLSISLSIPDHPLAVKADTDALDRVFANLLQNAGRYAKSKILIKAEEHDTRLTVSFINDLKEESMEEQEVEKLFLPFYRGDNSRTSAGTQGSSGLGLSIARRLSEHMGGRLEARLETSSPTISFALILPREMT